MTTEALNDFTNALRSDKAMAEGLVAAMEGKTAGEAAAAFAAYAEECGYAVARQDAEAVLSVAQPGDGALSDEQLDGVSGGFLHLIAAPVLGAVSGAFDGAVRGAATGAVDGVMRVKQHFAG